MPKHEPDIKMLIRTQKTIIFEEDSFVRSLCDKTYSTTIESLRFLFSFLAVLFKN